MPRPHRQLLPFRVPFFRIFYSTTYTITFLITLFFLAITPGSLLYEAIENGALQYVFIIAGTYFLTACIAIFIYSSRLYTNRSILAGVGKTYIPIEEGEIGNSTRKMIISQLERSAVVSWEAKPRDIKGEIVFAQREGLLNAQNVNNRGEIESIGTIVAVNLEDPPWGRIQHPGWTAPSDAPSELQSDLQFEVVIAELPNLLEARAVSLAPSLPDNEAVSDPRFIEILRRQDKMGMREYMTQLSYLQLVDLQGDGRELMTRYERARFSGTPTSYSDFNALMNVFGVVLDGMQRINPAIAEQIQAQVHTDYFDGLSIPSDEAWSLSETSPVTARTRLTSHRSQAHVSSESLSSVIRNDQIVLSSNSSTFNSDAGSIVRHHIDDTA